MLLIDNILLICLSDMNISYYGGTSYKSYKYSAEAYLMSSHVM